MATLAHGAVTSSDAQYRVGYSARLYKESIVNNPLSSLLTESGCINVEPDLSKNKGGTVTMYNSLKISSKGFTGDVDMYSNATLLESSSRTMVIAKNSLPITYPLQGSQTHQFTPFDIGENKVMQGTEFMNGLLTAGIMNQGCGNNATSITQSALDPTAFTGSDLTRLTGNNSVTAPTRWYWANLGGAVSTDASIQNTNLLSIKDFQYAAEVIGTQPTNGAAFQPLIGKPYIGVAIIGYTGLNQMINEAVTTEQGFQLSQIIRAQIQSGKAVSTDLETFTVPGIPFRFVAVPDQWVPRGVQTSGTSEVANSRRAVIMGANAIDMSFGAGFTPAGGRPVPGVDVEIDPNHKKLNKMGYANFSLLWGCKKTTTTSSGSGSSTAYDLSTYVITHYART